MRTGELYQRYYGLYLGTVVSTNDPEGLGRVRVKMDQYEDSKDEPVFAAVARPAASGNLTVFFSPREGDQVVVGFLVGDVNEPIILGYAHSTEKKPPGEVSPPTKHGIVVKDTSVVFDETDVVVNEGDQKVARVEDSVDAGTIVFVVSGGVLTTTIMYFPAGAQGTKDAGDFAFANTNLPSKFPVILKLSSGLITSGASHFKA
jgi:hypothetical protein